MDLDHITLDSNPPIEITNITVQNGNITAHCSYDQNIVGIPIEVKLKWVVDDISFTATTNLELIAQPPLKVYSSIERREIVGLISDVVQYFYLAAFVVSLFTVKLIGIEMVSLIQLTFYSLIPLDTISVMFKGLYEMAYVSGFNLNLQGLKEVPVSFHYSNLNLKSNFLSNFNAMLAPILLCPVIFLILRLASSQSNSYKFKPRLKKYSMAFLCEWLFTMTIFSTYNIMISLVINVQSLGAKDPISLAVSFLSALLPVTAVILYVRFDGKYEEFSSQLNHSGIRVKQTVDKSKRICGLYPMIISAEIALIGLLLSVEFMFDYSLYCVLAVTIATTVFVCAAHPYEEKLNNVRIMVHRGLMTVMAILMVVCKVGIDMYTEPDSPIMMITWVILIVLILSFLINFPFILWKTYLWIRTNGIIDMKMLLEQKIGTMKEEAQNQVEKDKVEDPIYYPIL